VHPFRTIHDEDEWTIGVVARNGETKNGHDSKITQRRAQKPRRALRIPALRTSAIVLDLVPNMIYRLNIKTQQEAGL
jgi:hypothetical protein